MAKTAMVILKVEPALKEKLEELAAQGDGNLSAIVREMLRENLKDRQCRDMIRAAEGRPQKAQEFIFSLDRRVERKRASDDEVMRLSGEPLE